MCYYNDIKYKYKENTVAKLEIVYNRHKGRGQCPLLKQFDTKTANAVQSYHSSFDSYSTTPLADLVHTANQLGTGGIFVKDESFRFGLNAFKGLGGSYCLGRYISNLCGSREVMPFERLASQKTRNTVGDVTFVTATDGNHGRGIAWAADKLGYKSVVYMPKGSAQERLDNIRRAGATAEITDKNYDDTVRFARRQAQEKGWVLVQDTTLPDYSEIPLMIMQGYLTMAQEAVQQLGGVKPTHLFLQAGVGSMAGAVAAYMHNVYGNDLKIIIVEPDKADCVYRTAKADDGSLHTVTGDMDTIMAGLACGEVCDLGWRLMQYCAHAFVSMEDAVAAQGMRILASSEQRVISGESGAAGFAAAAEILLNHNDIKQQLGIDKNSVLLCFSTEGATDRENWRRIVWQGKYPTE